MKEHILPMFGRARREFKLLVSYVKLMGFRELGQNLRKN
jgi:hypothetical protein|tara:strand:+ start:359 stop:475 length:117 start_codon:yes stop_codon:yes gene_type:complete